MSSDTVWELSREGQRSADWGPRSVGRDGQSRVAADWWRRIQKASTSGRVFDGGDCDWLMQNYVSYRTEQQEESRVRKADVCAGVDASGCRLEAVSHRAASGRLVGVWPAGRAPPYEAADWPEIIT